MSERTASSIGLDPDGSGRARSRRIRHQMRRRDPDGFRIRHGEIRMDQARRDPDGSGGRRFL